MTIGNKTATGTCYVVGSEHLTRQQLYTAMTRATDESHIFLSTAETDAHRPIPQSATRHYAWPTTVFPLILATYSFSVPRPTDIAYTAQQFTQTDRLRQ
jgi:hypothetical protein